MNFYALNGSKSRPIVRKFSSQKARNEWIVCDKKHRRILNQKEIAHTMYLKEITRIKED